MATSPQLQLQAPYSQQLQPQQQQQLLLQGPGGSSSISPARPRKCAEVCLDLLFTEAVQFFTEEHYGPAAGSALQAVGFRVGRQLAERYSRDKPRMGDTLEVIKFICKDFWQAVFKKQVDNLKTNHRGIYMLQDNNFRWLLRVAPAAAAPEGSRPAEHLASLAQPYLELPCGIIRGALCAVHCCQVRHVLSSTEMWLLVKHDDWPLGSSVGSTVVPAQPPEQHGTVHCGMMFCAPCYGGFRVDPGKCAVSAAVACRALWSVAEQLNLSMWREARLCSAPQP
ncbi:transport protein particle component-domain-containing protein [Scenedesmus sp. NREL 46B-D3]|nr:transport protein particle component-domain-containing protein [Scenedesmus sp. NREL 46B-D3]